MIKKFSSLKKHHQLIFSLVVVSGVVCIWRGIWGLLDLYLLPGQLTLSYSLSIIIGVVVVAVTHFTIDKLT